MPVLVVLRKIQRKAIPRIAQPLDLSSVSRTWHSVLRGLGLRLNRQKNHSFCGSGMNGFSHLYIQMHCLPVLCQIWYNLGKQCICVHKPCCDKSRKQCLWRAICEKRSFLLRQIWAFSSLLGDLPSPLNPKFLVSCAPCGRLCFVRELLWKQWCYVNLRLT